MGRPSTSTRRRQILAAAAPLFARHGFHGVSVDDLGAATGVSGAALYRHFRAKEDILAELLVEVSQTLLDGARRKVGEAPDAGRALDVLIAWHLEFALANPDVITVQSRELANLPADARGAVRALQQRYVALWADVVTEVTGCRRDVAVPTVHAAFGLMNSTPFSAKLARQEMGPLLFAMTRAALLATRAGQSGHGGTPAPAAPPAPAPPPATAGPIPPA